MGGCRSKEQVEEDVEPTNHVPCEFEHFQRLSYGYYCREEEESEAGGDAHHHHGEGDVFTQGQEVEKFYYQDNEHDHHYSENRCNDTDEFSDWDIIEVDSHLHTIPEEEDFHDDNDIPNIPPSSTLERKDSKDSKVRFSRRPMFNSLNSEPSTISEEADGKERSPARGCDGNDCSPSRGRCYSSYSIDSFMSDQSAMSNNTFAPELYNDQKPTRIQVYLKYNQRSWLLTVGVKQAECSMSSVDRRRRIYWQVHMTLFPYKRHRHKTSYKTSLTPIFNQSFDIEEIATHALSQMSVRYRMYGRIGLTGRKQLAGEVEVELGCIMESQDNIVKEWKSLKKRIPSTPTQ